MKRRSLRECLPMLPCPVWPLAGQSRLGQNMGAGSMLFLLALIWHLPRVGLAPRFCYKSASPRFSAELPIGRFLKIILEFHGQGRYFLVTAMDMELKEKRRYGKKITGRS